MPAFECLDRCFMMQCRLGYSVVVEPNEALERLFQVFGIDEVMRVEDLGNAAVEAFDHSVGLWVLRVRQAVLDADGLAKCMAEL